MASFVQSSEDGVETSSHPIGPMGSHDIRVSQHYPMDQAGCAVPTAEDDAASSGMTRGFAHSLFLDMSHLGPPFPADGLAMHHPTGQAIRPPHHLLTPSPSPVCWGSPSLASNPWPCPASAAPHPETALGHSFDPQEPSSTAGPTELPILHSSSLSTTVKAPGQPLDQGPSHETTNAALCLQYPSLYMGHPLVPDLELVKAGYAEDLARLHRRLAVFSQGFQMGDDWSGREYGKGM